MKKNGQSIDRRIDFYIGTVSGKGPDIDPNEVHDFMWLTFDKALKKITFPESRKVFEDVIRYLESR